MGYYSARHEPGGNQVSLGDSVATAEREALRCARRQEGQVAAEHRQQRRPGSTRACVEGTRLGLGHSCARRRPNLVAYLLRYFGK